MALEYRINEAQIRRISRGPGPDKSAKKGVLEGKYFDVGTPTIKSVEIVERIK